MNIVVEVLGAVLRRLPEPVQKSLHNYQLKTQINTSQKKHQLLINQVRNKKIIQVIFLVIHDSVWKYEEVYDRLDKDPRFDVKVVVIPLVNAKEVDMANYDRTLTFFQKNNYHTLGSYDSNNKIWLNIKKLTQPDVVFFTNPHHLTYDQYYINNFKEVLTCYVPYAFVVIHLLHLHYNLPIHHLLWRYFVETTTHLDFASSYSMRDASNVVVSGFPGLDRIFRPDYKPLPAWKHLPSTGQKRIVWAPHHTISSQGSGLDYSSFETYSNYFINLLQQRADLQIAFKPHPLLKEKLYQDPVWGTEKTNLYYAQWNELPNGQLEEGPYIDLFYHSDALILDSASFIVEYLYFDKPILFTMRDESMKERFNTFGQMVFDYLYTSTNQEETGAFIDGIVLKENDPMKETRNQFLEGSILPENGKTASENIYNELVRELCP